MAQSLNVAPAGGTVVRGADAGKSFRLPTDDDELIQWLNAKREQGKPMMPYNQMKLNMAMYLGFQWVTWDHRMRAYRRPTIDIQDPNTPVRISSNKIGGLGERTIAKLTKTLPEPEVRPVSDDDDDVDSARVGTRILTHELDRLDWNVRLQQFLQWPVALGWGYAHPWWNPKGGSKVAPDPDDDMAEPIMEGEVEIDYVAPFDLNVDPSARSMREARWAVRTTCMTREEAWEKFDVELTGGEARSLEHEVQALGSTGQVDPAHPSEEWVNVYQLWMVPCKAAPQGCVITWANQEVIEKKMKYPFQHNELPFLQCNLLPGFSREGRTWVTDLLPLQTDYNDTLSREATIRRQLTPKFIGAVGQVDPQRITSRVEVLQYMPGFGNPPALMEPNGSWAQQFEMGMARDASDMGERSGMSDASTGKSASTAPAASIMALQETDDTKMFLSATCLASFISQVGRQILLLCRQYWTEERTVRTWSDADYPAAYRYLGADIDDRLDVHISAESALPRSKAARAQLVLELQQRFPDLLDPQTVMSLLEVPGVDLITRTLDEDTRLQQREIGEMLQGQNPIVKPFHNHTIHLKVINSFRKSLEYLRMQPIDQARIDAHAAVHEMLVLRQQGVNVQTPNPMQDPTSLQQSQQAGQPGGLSGPGAPAAPQGPQDQPQPPGGSSLSDQATALAAGIGATGQPGRVPNMPVDQQAASMGS